MASKSSGFTLVELAIVLFIITLLLGGMLTPLSQQISERQTRDTRSALETARTALIGYALSHRDNGGRPYLPCPDQTGGDGIEDRLAEGRCISVVGSLPWHTLGVAESDAWGNRITYAISPEFANASHGIAHHPAPASEVRICLDQACAQPLTAAAALLSHGRNGFGARNSLGKTNLGPSSASERANADGTPRFITRAPSTVDSPEGEFDDIVTWISPAWLLGRLCDPAAACAAE